MPANPDLFLEGIAPGELIVMAPVGGEAGSSAAELVTDLVIWDRCTKMGKVFRSSTIFSLPWGCDRPPLC